MPVSTEKLIEYLTAEYGPQITRSQLSDASNYLGMSLSTTIKRLSDYKSGRGVWNLTVQEALVNNLRKLLPFRKIKT